MLPLSLVIVTSLLVGALEGLSTVIWSFNLHTLVDHGTQIIALCSVLHTILPPWDMLDDFPTAQKYYKLFIYVVGYVALNGRSTAWKSISVNNPNGPNANIPTIVKAEVGTPTK